MKKLLSQISAAIVRFWCEEDPRDKLVDELNDGITYLHDCIDSSEFLHEFTIIESEIKMFIAKWSPYGFDDFGEVVKAIYEHLSERQDEYQELWSIH